MYVFVESSFNMFKLLLGFDLILFFIRVIVLKGRIQSMRGIPQEIQKLVTLI